VTPAKTTSRGTVPSPYIRKVGQFHLGILNQPTNPTELPPEGMQITSSLGQGKEDLQTSILRMGSNDRTGHGDDPGGKRTAHPRHADQFNNCDYHSTI
jgi:hypothetical protein